MDNIKKIDPAYMDGKCVGLSLYAQPKTELRYIDVKITLSDNGDIEWDNIPQ